MRVQVIIKVEHGNYRKGERLNLPLELAEELIKKDVAERIAVSAPENKRKKKAVSAPENKAVGVKP